MKFGITQATVVAQVVLVLALALAATAELGFSRSVTPGLVDRYAALFGNSARRYLKNWQNFVQTTSSRLEPAQYSKDAPPVLDRVNDFINRLPSITDIEHWKVVDYWATPAEMFASDGGDCEDFVIAKYFTLKELGVPIERLRMVYVRTWRSSEAHMVLAYYPKTDATPLILDNLYGRIVPATERPDLIPVYSFNDENLMFAGPNPASQPKSSSTQIRQWKELLEKLEMELRY